MSIVFIYLIKYLKKMLNRSLQIPVDQKDLETGLKNKYM